MIIKNHLSKVAIVGVLCMTFLAQPAQAYAYWRGGWGWGWGWPVVGAVALGAAATSIWIANHQYYYYDGLYYDYTPRGYVVVTPPVTTTVVPAPQAVTVTQASDDVITLNIPNDKGGYTAVTLKRSAKGFIGPQGEFYPDFPRISQLKLMYGK
jgi:hypothetical protein